MEESSWRSHYEGVIKEESSWSHHGAWRRYHGGVWELSGGALEALWGLSGGSLEAGVAFGWPWGDLGLGGAFCIVKHCQNHKNINSRESGDSQNEPQSYTSGDKGKKQGDKHANLEQNKHCFLKL